MTAESEARPAPPTEREAAPSAPVARAVARVTPVVHKVRARAAVPGAIDPSHRNREPFRPPLPREPSERSAQAEGRADVAGPAEAAGQADAADARRAEPGRTPTPSTEAEPTSAPKPALVPRKRSVGKAAVGKASLVAPPGGGAPPGKSPPVRGSAPIGAAAPPREITVTPGDPLPGPRPARRSPKGWRQRALLPVVVGVAAAFTAGTGYLAIKQPPLDPEIGRWGGTHESAAPYDAAPFAVPDASATSHPFGARSSTPTGVPTRLKVKAIGLDTSLETLHLDEKGVLTPPKKFGKAGWYADGTRPGDVGPAVIAGHVDSKKGPAVFYELRELEAGDTIEVTRGGETVTFTVTSTGWYPKKDFPTAQVYGPTPDRQLRLITCGGVFDHSLRSYKDNLVVYAVAG